MNRGTQERTRNGAIAVKRAFDIAGSLIGCFFTALVLPVFAAAIRLDSEGPVFFVQERIGRDGKPFRMFKFRSMVKDAEERKSALLGRNMMRGPVFKMENDPRVTRVGRFLRRTSLDELPQFWNVLRGEMSLVGARPPLPEEYAAYSERDRRRLAMRPGMTGLWQVSGRSDITDFAEIVRLDLTYIDTWTPGMDARILAKTVRQLFTGKGAR
ncbi:MAG: exopolysaccharide biosynthesis polyprenyl glycosylphosphotransferase [Lachnospiraceae bacterium]|nr:exopolysaccharide biosynthesis polyprenyl glycosylphosphotransferase [Lachnospiraceae bacterium]